MDMAERAKNCTYGNPDCPKCNPKPIPAEVAAIDRQINVALSTRNGQVTRLRREKIMLVARAMKDIS